ncbi:Conserved_hypothetical protein [Hexamita inflata]|uniref:Uncharacterized protein n=1 Tax=Hexamita inflata TaxID=28002 RepID=A0AA86PU08_9EUKA|nr:Conserved hypothetical protein [Hexamita inflata]
MILLTQLLSEDWCKQYTDNQQYNPIIVIDELESIGFAYIAYKVQYVNFNPQKQYLKYVYTSVIAEQTQIHVTVYGQVQQICTSEVDNIKLLSQVSQVTDLQNFRKLVVKSNNVTFIDSKYQRCYFDKYFINIASNSHGQLLELYGGKTQNWSLFQFNENTCEKRTFIDIKPETGIIKANNKEVMYPVYNPNLSLYNKDYGNFLFPQIRIKNLLENYLIQAPCNPLEYGDTVQLSESIMFGEHYEYIENNNVEQILVGAPLKDRRKDGFENISIINKCVQFYANSPRDIEYPLGSGIIFNIRTERKHKQEQGYYTYFYGPYICVDNFTYMPAMFYTYEDPELLTIMSNLTTIQNEIIEKIKNGTWEYSSDNKQEQSTAEAYTQSLLLALQEICLKAYFSDEFMYKLIQCLGFIFCPLIAINIIVKSVTKPQEQQQVKDRIDYVLSLVTFVSIMIILFIIVDYQLALALVFLVGLIYVFLRGLKYYVVVDSANNEVEQGQSVHNTLLGDLNKQQIEQKRITFWIQYMVQALIKTLDIIQTVTDIMQILQYLQIQYYSNRISNLYYLMYPSEKILYAAEYLAESTAYPILLLCFSLINQEIMKQEWFKNCIKSSPNPLDNKTFLIKMLIQVFGYFQGFVYNIFFAFTDTKLNFDFIKNEQVKYNVQAIVKIYLSGTIYSISKFKLILEYYQQINKSIIKIFSHFVQIITNILLLLTTIFKIIKYIVKGKSYQIQVQTQILTFSILQLIYYVVMLVLDPIVTIFLPTTLMFQELTKLCPFLLQVVGICDHQNEFAKQTTVLLTTNYKQFILSVLSSMEVYGICLFFGLLFSKNQLVSIKPQDQWQAICFAIILLITPYVSKNIVGNYLMQKQLQILQSNRVETFDNINTLKQDEEIVQDDGFEQFSLGQHEIDSKTIQQQVTESLPQNSYKIKPFSFQYKTIELQNELTEASCQYHKSLLNVRGDYKHEASYYEDFLSGLIFTGYGVIPGFGIILATVAKYMNNTGFASDGECITQKSSKEIKRHIWNVINDICLLLFIIIGIYSALCSEDKPFYLTIIGFFIFIFYYQLLDEQMIEVYQHNIDYYITQSCQKSKNPYKNAEHINENIPSIAIEHHIDDELIQK